MVTSVHIPKLLLEAVDRRAQALRISRNRLILKALEREIQCDPGWSAGFFDQLAVTDAATARAADDMLANIRASRRSKRAVRL
jgi:metal-responsive CopG/Arc/MetJ family transcriptional regulator